MADNSDIDQDKVNAAVEKLRSFANEQQFYFDNANKYLAKLPKKIHDAAKGVYDLQVDYLVESDVDKQTKLASRLSGLNGEINEYLAPKRRFRARSNYAKYKENISKVMSIGGQGNAVMSGLNPAEYIEIKQKLSQTAATSKQPNKDAETSNGYYIHYSDAEPRASDLKPKTYPELRELYVQHLGAYTEFQSRYGHLFSGVSSEKAEPQGALDQLLELDKNLRSTELELYLGLPYRVQLLIDQRERDTTPGGRAYIHNEAKRNKVKKEYDSAVQKLIKKECKKYLPSQHWVDAPEIYQSYTNIHGLLQNLDSNEKKLLSGLTMAVQQKLSPEPVSPVEEIVPPVAVDLKKEIPVIVVSAKDVVVEEKSKGDITSVPPEAVNLNKNNEIKAEEVPSEIKNKPNRVPTGFGAGVEEPDNYIIEGDSTKTGSKKNAILIPERFAALLRAKEKTKMFRKLEDRLLLDQEEEITKEFVKYLNDPETSRKKDDGSVVTPGDKLATAYRSLNSLLNHPVDAFDSVLRALRSKTGVLIRLGVGASLIAVGSVLSGGSIPVIAALSIGVGIVGRYVGADALYDKAHSVGTAYLSKIHRLLGMKQRDETRYKQVRLGARLMHNQALPLLEKDTANLEHKRPILKPIVWVGDQFAKFSVILGNSLRLYKLMGNTGKLEVSADVNLMRDKITLPISDKIISLNDKLLTSIANAVNSIPFIKKLKENAAKTMDEDLSTLSNEEFAQGMLNAAENQRKNRVMKRWVAALFALIPGIVSAYSKYDDVSVLKERTIFDSTDGGRNPISETDTSSSSIPDTSTSIKPPVVTDSGTTETVLPDTSTGIKPGTIIDSTNS